MTLDMWKIAEHANPSGTAILPVYWCASLQPVMIFFGSIPRFYLNECRYQSEKNGPSKGVARWAWFVGGVSFLVACVIFGVCTGSLVEFIWDDGTPPNKNMRLDDAYVVTLLMLLQIGYPLVFLFSILYMHVFCAKDNWKGRAVDYPAWLSFCTYLNNRNLHTYILLLNIADRPAPSPFPLHNRQRHGLRNSRYRLQGRPRSLRGHARDLHPAPVN
tara:strand:- start:85 stop:732 length:648 start_codon:yes stop_codon:yes gene_type:complete